MAYMQKYSFLIIFVLSAESIISGMDQIWDPLRKKNVAATPEERVRQWFISLLHGTMGVPVHMMKSEVGFRWGGKAYRADILIWDRAGKPLAVVECKRPDVQLDAAVAEQAMRYNAVLDVRWIFLTNGGRTLLFRRSADTFVPADSIPTYEQMTCE